MKLKQRAAGMIPAFVKNRIRVQKELRQLGSAQRTECRTANLRDKRDISVRDIFNSPEIDATWLESEKEITQCNIPEKAGGVNPGDRRAIYYLISAIKPVSVLEIGTHIGASTIHIASALRNNADKNASVTTVDVIDVNSQEEKPWLQHGTNQSPIEMIDKTGCGSLVTFITGTSLQYAANCQKTFDFIFLDGDHSASPVGLRISFHILIAGCMIRFYHLFRNDYRIRLYQEVRRGFYHRTYSILSQYRQFAFYTGGITR